MEAGEIILGGNGGAATLSSGGLGAVLAARQPAALSPFQVPRLAVTAATGPWRRRIC